MGESERTIVGATEREGRRRRRRKRSRRDFSHVRNYFMGFLLLLSAVVYCSTMGFGALVRWDANSVHVL